MTKTLNFQIPCSNEENFYTNYLKIINGVNKLTPIELGIMSGLMTSKNAGQEPFSISSKRQIAEKVKISEDSLNNYLSTLRKKKMLVIDEKNKKQINPNLFVPMIGVQELNLQFSFKLPKTDANTDV